MGVTKSRKLKLIFLYISIILITVIMFIPIVWMASTSIKTDAEVFTRPIRWVPRVPTLNNFITLIRTPKYSIFFVNSWIIATCVMVITVTLASFAGYGLARFKFPGSELFSTSILLSQMLPPILLVIPYFMIMKSIRLYNTYWGVILIDSAYSTPFCIWMLRGYFATIPKELDEAALIDGCSHWSTFFKVALPLTIPGLIGTAIFSFLWGWSEFLFVFILTRSDQLKTVTVGAAALVGQYAIDWNLLMALALLANLPLLVAFIFLQQHLVRGLTGGALKG